MYEGPCIKLSIHLYVQTPLLQPSEHRDYNQCHRLYHCIQGAVASVAGDDTKKEWAAKRIRILMDLIPSNPIFPLSACTHFILPLILLYHIDAHTFYGALVKHILSMLKERDSLLKDRDWVLNEALSGKKLQSGGTFQNVLSRRLDEVVLPLFSSVLSFIDHYSNLDLIAQRLAVMHAERANILFLHMVVNILAVLLKSCGYVYSVTRHCVDSVMKQ